jgi:hypothetical protein
MSEDGIEAAIVACQMKAPTIAGAAGSDSIRVGRTSHRLRNPENAPSDWVAPILESYLATPDDIGSRSVRIDAGRVGYVEPIRVMPMCLTCHGSEIPSSVQSRLDELYPEDQATGFEEGDLRGLFWVEVRTPR